MREFLLAIQFLTIIPLKIKSDFKENKPSLIVTFFPEVGLLLGFMLMCLYVLSVRFFNSLILSDVLIITFLIFITGGLHLDGLADTTDALMSRKNKDEMLKIMRDSHIGTMGVLSLICIILIKFSLLSSMKYQIIKYALIMMCLLSRYSLVLLMYFFDYAREEGKAQNYIENTNVKVFLNATLATLGFSFLILRFQGLFLFVFVSIIAYLMGFFFSKKFGGITGDILGATCEVTEVLTLLSIFIFNIHL